MLKRLLMVGVLCLAATAQAGPYLYDMGTAQSDVWPGFTRVTVEDVCSAQKDFGWQTKEGLKAHARAYKDLVENKSRGAKEPPPIWTNAITEDTIVGSGENAFLIKAPPGEYEVYVVCGSSEGFRNQYFDFTVQVGPEQRRVQVEGGYQFKSLRFHASVGQEPLAVRFTPRSKWFVNAVMAWTAADAPQVQKDVIAPFEEWTYRMPSEEWAKWKKDEEPDPGPMPQVSDADQKRGFIVYTRHYLECVYPHMHPRVEEMNPELRLFASQGEYEPCNFIVYPLKDLSGAKVTVSAVGPIPSGNVDVRRVRYMLARPNYRVMYRYRVVPDVLERFESLDLAAGENARFWITIRVPDDAPAGTYTGKATFECAGGRAETPIRLRVLPVKLREDPSKIFGIYYHHPYAEMAGAEDEVSKEYFRHKAEMEHEDMVEHGTRNVTLGVRCGAADQDGRFNADWDTLAAEIALWRKHDFKGPIVMSIGSSSVYRKYVKGDGPGSHLRSVQDPPEEFSRELTAMVKYIEAERQKRGWPEFLYYPVDEPSTAPDSIKYMVKVLKACKEAAVRTYVTADPTNEGFEPMRPYVDVWCTQPFAPDRETILADMAGSRSEPPAGGSRQGSAVASAPQPRYMKARKVEYWCYPNHISGENDHTPVTGARMTYGFGFWRSGFLTLIPWIYSASAGDPFNYLDGSAMDFFNRREPDGRPIPVTLWEAFREGHDDYRYLYTLEQLIAEAKGGARAGSAAKVIEAAERELKFVWDAIRVQTKYKYDDLWAPADFDVYRWLIARQILALQDALGTR